MARELARPLPRSAGFAPSLLTGLAALGDILLLHAWLVHDLLMIAVMALHLCLALAFGALARLVCGQTPSRALAGLAILALFGPFGGPVLMMIGPAPVALDRPAVPVAGRPLSPLPPRDAADDLFDQIRQHRRHPLPGDGVPGFLQTFRTGTLRQQQEAIAAISRGYHPDMRPALAAALASPVPALRVQAAAVHAKLRGTHGARAKAMLADPGQARDRAALLEIAASGFVDEDTCARLLDLAAEDSPSVAAPPMRPALAPPPRLKRYSCGGLA
ncbi:hypothetical protein GIY56_14445 [Paracoccus sp. YIM 132242]|uniref:Uncharacterized protein n=1 Tax=Paracoccus lichenicola TaxID=2665644 RepID=A0A6L6HTP3_9RHOB|nr:hypothetical protein [Paracoccus lichenicola]MTE01485.1 hypothetical protein [Paracoccus lichenicola]